jgi:polyhydroxyalkanoate synthase subunit PhaC
MATKADKPKKGKAKNTFAEFPKGAFDAANEATMALGPLAGLAREDFAGAIGMMLRQTAANPQSAFKAASGIMEDSVKIMTGQSDLAPDAKDKRFMDPAWTFNPFFKAGAQYYLAVQKGVKSWIEDLALDALERDRANFISQMVIDALAPTNTLIGNPTAQKRLVDSGGLSLIKGLKNAYDDMVNNDMMVSQVNKKPFKLGENIATTPGKVVHREEMFELVQYTPATEEVYAIPQLTIPPQINKMYINDLSPEKSIIKWQVAHGFQTFVISWRNPTHDQGVWGMAEYVSACQRAVDVVCEITGSDKVNVSGGCSGGQTMSVLCSKMAALGDDRINAITMMVCVLEPKTGDTEASSMVSHNGIALARQRAAKKGVIEGSELARGFAWLRPNDLIWNYVINNYLLGDDPPAFDILFWNADATNLSSTLMGDFLELFEANAYAAPGTFEVAGHTLDLTKVKGDIFILGGTTDHITPWQACYRSTQLFGAKNVEFVLSQAGHMQAILNPPGNPKARFWRNAKGKTPKDVGEWQKGCEEIPGSWWPHWTAWLAERSGKKVAAPSGCGSKTHSPMEDAPGLYVLD